MLGQGNSWDFRTTFPQLEAQDEAAAEQRATGSAAYAPSDHDEVLTTGPAGTPDGTIPYQPAVNAIGSYTSTYSAVPTNFSATGTNRISISAAAGVQNHATVVGTGNGNAVSLYFDSVSGQIVGSTLSPTGAVGSVVTLTTASAQLDFNAAGDNEPVSAARLVNGNIVVTWPVGSSIYARVFTANLVPVTGEVLVGSPTTGFAHEYFPDVAALAGGDFVVAWQDLLGASESHIRVARFTATGAAVTSFTADAPANLNDERPSIAGLSDGGYVLGFDRRDNAQVPSTHVYAALYNADNSVRAAVAQLDSGGRSINRDVELVARPNGSYSIYYETGTESGDTAIATMVSPNNSLPSGSSGAFGTQTKDHGVVGGFDGPAGYSVVLWNDTFTTTDHSVRGTLVSPTGATIGFNSTLAGSSSINTASGVYWLDSSTIAVVYENNTGTLAADMDGSVEMRAVQIQRTSIGSGNDDTIDFTNDPFVNIISAGGGNDTVYGGSYSDRLEGNDGDDTLYGGADDDELDGGAGANLLYGGLGNDRYDIGVGRDTIVEYAGEGTRDYVVTALSSYTLPANVEGLHFSLTTTGATGIGNELDNLMDGGQANDQLYGLDGNDSIAGLNGNDIIHGGDGNDLLLGGAGLNQLFGEAGDDRLVVDANGSGTIVDGGADHDTLVATGPVSLGGLTGIEAVELQSGAVLTLTATQFNTLGPGSSLSGTGSIAVNVEPGSPLDARNLSVVAGSTVSFTINGSSVADTITGSAGAPNTIYGGDGNDQITGGTGSDKLYGGKGDDTYVITIAGGLAIENAGEGTDTVRSSVDFTLGTNVENLTLTGTAAIDGTGNAGNNVLRGNSGANRFYGNGGTDTFYGGAGDDQFFVDSADDVVIELSGEGSNDVVVASVSYTLAANSFVEGLRLTGTANIDATGNANLNKLTGNSGGNVLDGGGGGDAMRGGDGNDTYIVRSAIDRVFEIADRGNADMVKAAVSYVMGANTWVELMATIDAAATTAINLTGNSHTTAITGNAGANVLTGGSGNEVINGLGGNDRLFGGVGADVFAFSSGSGQDVVGDFVSGTDKLDLSLFFASFSAFQSAASDVGGNAVIDLGGGNTITLTGVLKAQVMSGDVILGSRSTSLEAVDAHVGLNAEGWFGDDVSNTAAATLRSFSHLGTHDTHLVIPVI